MKKLIIITIVLVIVRPQVVMSCLIPSCPNMGEVYWEFTEDGCMPTSDEFNPPYCYDPDLPSPRFGTSYSDGGPVWTWADGVYTVNDEDGLNQPIPDRGGKQYLRLFFEVVHTIVESEDPSLMGIGIELWNRYDWSGCPTGAALMGEYDGNYFPPPTDTFDLGGGWYRSVWVFDFSTDGSVGTGFFPGLHEATHTTALIGMLDFADFDVTPFEIDEVHIKMVWHNYSGGLEPYDFWYCTCFWEPPPEPPLEFDPNFSYLFEPYDPETMGPQPQGPTSGTVRVRLSWQPEESNDVHVIINPDPNNEVTPNPDIFLPASTEPNGVVRLIFNQSNYDVWQTVVIKAVKDLEKEGNENHYVSFSTQTSGDPNFDGYETLRSNPVIDNDIPYIIAQPDDIEISENDPCTPVCFDVKLSHLPTAEVKVFVADGGQAADEGMFKITPSLGIADEPNCLTFTVNPGQVWDPCTMTSGFNVSQSICVNAIDNDELAEAWEEIIDGEIILTPQSEDEWYDHTSFGGQLEAKVVNVEVQDNECGAWGYNPADGNKDCYVNLGDVVLLWAQWLYCTQPYEDGCDKMWNLFPPEE